MSCLTNLPDVFLFKDKVLSIITWVSINLILLTIIISNPGIIYLLLNFLIFFIVVSFFYVRVLNFVNKNEPEIEPNQDYAFISEQTLQKIFGAILGKINEIYQKSKSSKNISDFYCEIKFLGKFFILGLMTEFISITIMTFIAINTIFVISLLKNLNVIDICEKYSETKQTIKSQILSVLSKIPKYSDLKLE